MFSNRKLSWTQLISFILIVVAGIIYFYLTNQKVEENSLKTSFNGIIEKISYNDKGEMNAVINDCEYYFNYNTNYRDKLFIVGDSLIKKDNSMEILQFRNNKLVNRHYYGVID